MIFRNSTEFFPVRFWYLGFPRDTFDISIVCIQTDCFSSKNIFLTFTTQNIQIKNRSLILWEWFCSSPRQNSNKDSIASSFINCGAHTFNIVYQLIDAEIHYVPLDTISKLHCNPCIESLSFDLIESAYTMKHINDKTWQMKIKCRLQFIRLDLTPGLSIKYIMQQQQQQQWNTCTATVSTHTQSCHLNLSKYTQRFFAWLPSRQK